MIALLSIKPEYAARIFDGSKKYEYRRSMFQQPVTKVVVYVSAPVSKVIGEFTVDDVLFDELSNLWHETSGAAGITEAKFLEYFSNREQGYAIKIGSVEKYGEPFRIREDLGFHPPQSFVYLTCSVLSRSRSKSDSRSYPRGVD